MTASVCFLDLDGVLVDLVGGLARAHGSRLTRQTWPATYDLSAALGMSHDACWSHPRVLGARFWIDLDPLPWASDLVDLLRQRFEHVVLLSQTVNDLSSYEGKARWCHVRFPSLPVLLGQRKTLVSAPDRLLVDDYEVNEGEWLARGGRVALVPGPWNRFRGTPDDRVLAMVETQLAEVVRA